MSASLAGVAFRVDPTSASWDYTVKTSETSTIGGIVIQVLGAELGDMTVQGMFGSEHHDQRGNVVGGWREQEDFLGHVKGLAQSQINPSAGAVRFLYPEKGWDYIVVVKGYSEIGSAEAVVAANENFNPTWQLRLFIVEDNSPVKTVQNAAMLQYINRLAAGLGWQQTKYNGPVTDADVQSFLAGKGVPDVATLLQGLGN